MNKQELFDKVVTHLRQQGKQAKENGRCQYRTQDGSKCAFGCLIEDNEYAPWMEGHSVLDVLTFKQNKQYDICPQSLIDRVNGNEDFLLELQNIHDSILSSFEGIKFWECRFADVAKAHNLTLLPISK